MKQDTFRQAAASWDSDQGRLNTAKAVADAIKSAINFKTVNYAMDFGCGTGLISMQMLPVIHNLIGVDLSDAMLNVFRAKIDEKKLQNIDLVKINSELDKLPVYPYELIFSSMTMHHVEHLEDLLHTIYNLLNKKGVLAVADLVKEEGDFHPDNNGVFHFGFDPQEFKFLLSEIGFKNISYQIIYTIKKETINGELKEFPVFLTTAEKK